MYVALKFNNLRCVMYLIETNKCRFDLTFLYNSIHNVHILKYMHEVMMKTMYNGAIRANSCIYTDKAIKEGHLASLKFMHQKGYAFDHNKIPHNNCISYYYNDMCGLKSK